MVAMVMRAEADKALVTLKGRKESKVGGTLQILNLGGEDSETADDPSNKEG